MKIFLNQENQDPNYLQIENQIKDQLYKGILKPYDQLPSIRQLAKSLGIAIITVKRAYDDLEKEGIIETHQGKGCFIKAQDRRRFEKQLEEELKEKLEKLIAEALRRGMTRETVEKIMRESTLGKDEMDEQCSRNP